MAYTLEHPISGASITVYFEMNNVPLSCTGWLTVDPMVMASMAPARGADRLIPGASGVRVKPRRDAPATRELELLVFGHQDWDGNPYADVREGIETNVDHLQTNLVSRTGSARNYVTGELHLPSGSTIDGNVHLEDLMRGPDTGVGLVTVGLSITIPAGVLS